MNNSYQEFRENGYQRPSQKRREIKGPAWQGGPAAAEPDQAQAPVAPPVVAPVETPEQRQNALLEGMRDDRLLRETFDSLTEAERAEYERQTDPAAVTRRIVEKIQAEQAEAFEKENAAKRERELMDYRAKNRMTPLERQVAIREANQRAAERQVEFEQARRDRELKAERMIGDPVGRLLSTLDQAGLQTFQKMLSNEPTAAQRLERIKAGTKQQGAQDKLSQLQAEYQAEIAGKHGTAAMLVRRKFRELGLSI